MKTALYSGSFDPLTNGHLDIIKKGAELFDKVIVAVAYNINKKEFIESGKKIELIKKCVQSIENVEVIKYEGLTAEFARKNEIKYLLRGLRNFMDFEYEKQIAQINSSINTDLETVFLLSDSKYQNVSSSMVKEILVNGGDISQYVPKDVLEFLTK